MSESFTAKQLGTVVNQVFKRGRSVVQVDDHTAVKFFGDRPHLVVRSTLAGVEGEVVLCRDSLVRLAQVLVEIGKTPVEPDIQQIVPDGAAE